MPFHFLHHIFFVLPSLPFFSSSPFIDAISLIIIMPPSSCCFSLSLHKISTPLTIEKACLLFSLQHCHQIAAWLLFIAFPSFHILDNIFTFLIGIRSYYPPVIGMSRLSLPQREACPPLLPHYSGSQAWLFACLPQAFPDALHTHSFLFCPSSILFGVQVAFSSLLAFIARLISRHGGIGR